MSSSPLGPVPPNVIGLSRKSFQVFTGEVCQVMQTLTESVMAPSQVSFELSYFWLGSNSGAMPAMRVKVPKRQAVLGRRLGVELRDAQVRRRRACSAARSSDCPGCACPCDARACGRRGRSRRPG